MAAAGGAWLWDVLWSERFWLPPNVSWADMEREEPGGEGFPPRADHLLVAFPLAAGLFLLRRLFERFIAKPCAMHFGIQENGPRRARPNAVLEKVFTSIAKCPDARRLEGLSKQLDWDVQKIQRWFRHRRNQEKSSIFTKFCESLISASLPSCLPPFWLLPLFLRMFALDIKRKDFLVMFIHHVAAIILIAGSYTVNMVRVGTLIVCLHDLPDIFLEAAKLAIYAKCQRLCDATFILFSVIFIVTRLGIYPFWILNTTLFESWEIIGPYQSWWLFNGLLVALLILHVLWSYFIIRTAYKALVRGKVTKDERSDIESSSEEEDTTLNKRKEILCTSTNGANRINGHITSCKWAEEE